MDDVLLGKYIIVHNGMQHQLLLDYAASLKYDVGRFTNSVGRPLVYRFTSKENVGRAGRIGYYKEQGHDEIDISMIYNHLISFRNKQQKDGLL